MDDQTLEGAMAWVEGVRIGLAVGAVAGFGGGIILTLFLVRAGIL